MKNVMKKARQPLSYAMDNASGISRFRIAVLTLTLLLTFVLSAILMLIVPIGGVRSDVIITFDDAKEIDGSYATYISQNTTLVAQSALRAREVRQAKLRESTSNAGATPQPQNYAAVHSVGNGFSLSTYGGDLITTATENRLALNDVLRAQSVHYGDASGVRFNVVGNAYEIPNFKLITILIFLCLVFSSLFMYVLSKFYFTPGELTSKHIRSARTDHTKIDHDHVFHDDTALPHDISFASGDMSHELADVRQESIYSPIDPVAVPTTPSPWDDQLGKNDYEKPHPQTREQVRPPKDSVSTHKSNLAQSWGNMGVRERLSSLQESFTPSKKKDEANSTITTHTDSASEIFDAEPAKNQVQKQVNKPAPHIHLRDLENSYEATAPRRTQSQIQTQLSGSQSRIKQELPGKNDGGAEQGHVDYFPQADKKASSGQSVPAGVPGNLPVVDISENFPDMQLDMQPVMQPDMTAELTPEWTTETAQQSASPVNEISEQTAPQPMQEVIMDDVSSQQSDSEGTGFAFDDSLDETDHRTGQRVDHQIEQTVTDLKADVPEPTDQELRDRLNRLLRGEL